MNSTVQRLGFAVLLLAAVLLLGGNVALRLVLAFVAMLLIVVTIHEGGHYVAARYYGVHVMRFCVGFGKPFFMRTDKHGTEWALAPFPLGGYVRMLDSESAQQSGIDPRHTLDAQNNWRSFVIYGAGPLANLLLSAVIMTFVFYGDTVGPRAQLDKVYADSPAQYAGMVGGEIIQSINGKETPFWSGVVAALLDAALSEQGLTVHTDGSFYNIAPGELVATDVERGIVRAFGVRPDENYLTAKLERVISGTPAANAELRSGDVIHGFNGQLVDNWKDLSEAIIERPDEMVTLQVWRDSESATLDIVVTLTSRRRGDERFGFLGVAPSFNREEYNSRLVTVYSGFWESAARGAVRVGEDVMRTLRFMGHVFFGELSVEKNVGGPVTIARAAASASEFGLRVWWAFVALISISLAVINLLPLPVLDGGRMVICMLQAIRRRNFSEQTLAVIDRIGVCIIIFLIFFVIAIDILRL